MRSPFKEKSISIDEIKNELLPKFEMALIQAEAEANSLEFKEGLELELECAKTKRETYSNSINLIKFFIKEKEKIGNSRV